MIQCLLTFFLLWMADFFSLERVQIPLLEKSDPVAEEMIQWPTTFHYLAKGRQAFVFESDEYVLKFFARLQVPPFASENKMNRLEKKMATYPDSYRLGFEKLRDETGILAVHVGKTDQHFPTVTLIDGSGKKLQVNLNLLPFVLQKKGKRSVNLSDAQFLDAFFAFHQKRIALLLADYDRGVQNYSWDDTRLLYIDPGRMYLDPTLQDPERARREWLHTTHSLRKWLSKNNPELVAEFDNRVKMHYSTQI
jgi:hypothetical protein